MVKQGLVMGAARLYQSTLSLEEKEYAVLRIQHRLIRTDTSSEQRVMQR